MANIFHRSLTIIMAISVIFGVALIDVVYSTSYLSPNPSPSHSLMTTDSWTMAQNYSLLSRSKRFSWEWQIDALKCTLKILSDHVSRFHSNQMMCCTLWKIKSMMKEAADNMCEKPEQTKQVYDEFLTQDLIYGSFAKSLLGDQELNCDRYPEGSTACAQLFFFILVGIVLLIVVQLFIIIGLGISLWYCLYYRRRYQDIYRRHGHGGSISTISDGSSMANNNYSGRNSQVADKKIRNNLNSRWFGNIFNKNKHSQKNGRIGDISKDKTGIILKNDEESIKVPLNTLNNGVTVPPASDGSNTTQPNGAKTYPSKVKEHKV